jgi:hypothetical protein
MQLSEAHKRASQTGGSRVEIEQLVLEIEPEVAGDLIVPGAAGVQPLAGSGSSAGQPVLDRRVHVLVAMIQRQTAARRRCEHLAESAADLRILGGRDEARGPEPLDVAEATEHIPGEEARIPGAVIAGRVFEESLVGRGRAPERGRPIHGS